MCAKKVAKTAAWISMELELDKQKFVKKLEVFLNMYHRGLMLLLVFCVEGRRGFWFVHLSNSKNVGRPFVSDVRTLAAKP